MTSPHPKTYFLPVERPWVNTSSSSASVGILTRSRTTWRSWNVDLYLIKAVEHHSPASLDFIYCSRCMSVPDIPLFIPMFSSHVWGVRFQNLHLSVMVKIDGEADKAKKKRVINSAGDIYLWHLKRIWIKRRKKMFLLYFS